MPTNFPQDPLDSLLDRWGKTPPVDAPLQSEVWQRIAVADTDDTPGIVERFKAAFFRPSFSITFAAACVLLGLFLVQVHIARREERQKFEIARDYLRLVDPLLRETPASAESTDKKDGLEPLLSWMKTDLQLSEEQLARIRSVHEHFGPQLSSLAARVSQMQRELAAFEKTRRAAGEIDFLEYARFTEQRHKLDQECTESTRKLVAESSDIMTPRQRKHYLQLVDPALNPRSSGSL